MRKRTRSFGAVSAVAILILIGLGVWQLMRRAEKLQIISEYEASYASKAQKLPAFSSWSDFDFKNLQYKKVVLEGRYDPYREFHLYAVIPQAPGRVGGAGWYVVSPLDLADGGTVFVNRGFVPAEKRDPQERLDSLADSKTQTITGFVRMPEKPNAFTPENDFKTNQWFLRDPAAFAAFGKIKNTAPLIVDQISSNTTALPQPGDGRVMIVNNHLQYALTWFALAIVAAGIAFIFVRKKT